MLDSHENHLKTNVLLLMQLKKLLLPILLSFSLDANATLIDRGNGLIYDSDQNLTWLQDANYALTSNFLLDNSLFGHYATREGEMNWDIANYWLGQFTYGGYNDWRFPITNLELDGADQTGSELGYLFYKELGGINGNSITAVHNENFNLFRNIQNGVYLSSLATTYYSSVWVFNMGNGYQQPYLLGNRFYAWPVREGDVVAAVPTVPEPSELTLMLLGFSLIALVGKSKKGSHVE